MFRGVRSVWLRVISAVYSSWLWSRMFASIVREVPGKDLRLMSAFLSLAINRFATVECEALVFIRNAWSLLEMF